MIMGISLKPFISKYFYKENIEEALDSIGEKTSGKIGEIESRLANTWPQYKDVYDLLDFLEEEDLLEICGHFSIDTEATTHSALKNRIKKSNIITGYAKKNIKKKSKDKILYMTPKENSHTNITHLSKWNMIIITIVVAVILTGVSMWWTSHVTETAQSSEFIQCVNGVSGNSYKDCLMNFEIINLIEIGNFIMNLT